MERLSHQVTVTMISDSKVDCALPTPGHTLPLALVPSF